MSLQSNNDSLASVNSEFSRLVSDLRLARDWKQKDLIQKAKEKNLKLSLNQLRDIEQGTAGHKSLLTHLPTLAQIFELTTDQINGFYAVAGFDYPYQDTERIARISSWLRGGGVLPYIFPREDTDPSQQVRWLIAYRDYANDEQRKIIQIGIEAFEMIVKHQKPISAVTTQTQETRDFLRIAVRSALQSRTLQIIDVKRNRELEFQLSLAYPHVPAFIAHIPPYPSQLIRAEIVALLAAKEAMTTLHTEKVVGVGPGYTLSRFATLNQPSVDKFQNTAWVPLSQTLHTATRHFAANQIACMLARQHPGSHALYFPNMPASPAPSQPSLDRYHEIIAATKQMKTAFISATDIGKEIDVPHRLYAADNTSDETWDVNHLFGEYADRFSGQVLCLFLDAQGNLLPIKPQALEQNSGLFDMADTYKKEIASILKRTAREGRVWMVAGGKYKARAVFTALENGFCNGLVIDSEIAQMLLRAKDLVKQGKLPTFD